MSNAGDLLLRCGGQNIFCFSEAKSFGLIFVLVLRGCGVGLPHERCSSPCQESQSRSDLEEGLEGRTCVAMSKLSSVTTF
jgi:hypothetical protein